MHISPPPDRRLFFLPILIVAALVPFYTHSWGLEGEASARFGSTHLSQESPLVSAQFSLSFGA